MSRAYTGQPDRPYLLAPALRRELCEWMRREPEFRRSSETGRRILVGHAVNAALVSAETEGVS